MKISQFHWKRRATQLAVLLLIALIPALGLFRIDLASASFFVFGNQIWWSSFAFAIGLAIIIITVPILTYMTIGTVWCGWACPQNLLSEWANNLTYKLLGKRADMRVDGEGMIVAAAKNKTLNWLILGSSFLVVSAILAFIPLLFFYPPSNVWDMVFSGHKPQANILIAYLFSTFLIFIDIAAIRYFFCDYACFYRMGQRIFQTRDALHVSFDASRSADCSKCNYCTTMCITNIQPTEIKPYDTCIDCGECIDACDRLHAKSQTRGLLRFEIGEKGGETTWGEKFSEISKRFNWLVGAVFLLGSTMMIWGLVTQEPIQAKMSYEERMKQQQTSRVCNSQCAKVQATCGPKNIEGCYRAAACKCACSLQQDPNNAGSASWRQCVQSNNEHAKTLHSRPAFKP